MANAAKIQNAPVRMLIVGYPGGGKTGAIASLLNAGFKVRLVDFEGNYQPLLAFTDPDKLQNLDIVSFQDKLMIGPNGVEPEGIPQAFNSAMKMLKSWKYTEDDGTEVDLGRSADWGPDTVVVVDSMTALGEVSMRRARKMMNKNLTNTTAAVWGMAVEDQMAFIKVLNAEKNRYHVVVLAHLQMIGPETPMSSNSESQDIKDLKEQMALERAELIPTRLYPRAVTKNLSTVIHKEFSSMIIAERKVKPGNKIERVLRTTSGEELDSKMPARNVEAAYPLETGLATIFAKLGARAPGSEGKAE